MKITLGLGLILCAAACSSEKPIDIPEIPVIHIGTGGVNTSSMHGSPREQYEELYFAMTKAHIVVRNNLGSNTMAVSSGMENIIHNLQRMQVLVTEPFRPHCAELIERYQGIYKEFTSRRYSNVTVTQFDQSEMLMRHNLDPDEVQVVTEVPVEPAKERKEDVVRSPVQGDSIPYHPNQAPQMPQISEKDLPTWMVFKAWEQADRDLQEGYRKNQGGCDALFQRVRESMALMKQRMAESDRPKFQYYINEYERVFAGTQGFSTLPEGTTREDVIADLKNVSKVVAETCNPDRK